MFILVQHVFFLYLLYNYDKLKALRKKFNTRNFNGAKSKIDIRRSKMADFVRVFQLSDPESGSDRDETWWNYGGDFSTNQPNKKKLDTFSPIYCYLS